MFEFLEFFAVKVFPRQNVVTQIYTDNMHRIALFGINCNTLSESELRIFFMNIIIVVTMRCTTKNSFENKNTSARRKYYPATLFKDFGAKLWFRGGNSKEPST